MNTSMPRPWVDFNPLMDADTPGRPGVGSDPTMPNPEPGLPEGLAPPEASLSDIGARFEEMVYYASFPEGYAREDARCFRETGRHLPIVNMVYHPERGTHYNYRPSGHWEEYNGERVFVIDTEGGVLKTGDATYRDTSGSGFAVESYVTGRTGLNSYSEGTRQIAPGTDLGEYFHKQRWGAELEATAWMTALVVGSILTIVGAGFIVGDLRLGLGYIRKGSSEQVFRFAFGGRKSFVHGHIHKYNWFKPWKWIHKLGRWKFYD